MEKLKIPNNQTKHYIKSIICATCLSINRQFVRSDKIINEIMSFFPKFIQLDIEEDQICWECHAILLKLYRFHKQIIMAQETLGNIMNGRHGVIKTLSTLKKCDKVTIHGTNSVVTPATAIFQYKSSMNTPQILEEPVLNTNEVENVIITSNIIQDVYITETIDAKPEDDTNDIFHLENNTTEETIDTKAVVVNNNDINAIKTEIDPLDHNEYKTIDLKVDKLPEVNLPDLDINAEVDHIKNETDIDIADHNVSDATPKTIVLNDAKTKKGKEKRNTKKINKKKLECEEKQIIKTICLDKDGIRYNAIEKQITTDEKMREIIDNERNSEVYIKAVFKCDRCVLIFRSETEHNKHMREHEMSSGPEVCDLCGSRFEHAAALHDHRLAHYTAVYCSVCGLWARSLVSLAATHLLHDHASLAPPAPPQPAPSASLPCWHCDASFSSYEELLEHARQHSAKLACSYCGKTFQQNWKRKMHELIHVGMPVHECSICHRKFRGRSLGNHMKNVHPDPNDKRYCVECDKWFTSSVSFDRHIKFGLQHAAPRFECDYCGKMFVEKRHLVGHVESHMGVDRHVCQCGKTYCRLSSLQAHYRQAHTGRRKPVAKSQVCNVCGKTLASREVLKKHLRIHTGEKPFQCAHCPWRFTQKSTLRTHHKYKHKGLPLEPEGAARDH